MNNIEFSIDNWQTYVNLLQTHEVRTRDGRAARILCTDRTSTAYPVVVLIDKGAKEEYLASAKANGKSVDGIDRNNDLMIVPIPPKSLGWVVVFKSTTQGGAIHAKLFDTEEQARAMAVIYTKEHSFQQVASITQVFENI